MVQNAVVSGIFYKIFFVPVANLGKTGISKAKLFCEKMAAECRFEGKRIIGWEQSSCPVFEFQPLLFLVDQLENFVNTIMIINDFVKYRPQNVVSHCIIRTEELTPDKIEEYALGITLVMFFSKIFIEKFDDQSS